MSEKIIAYKAMDKNMMCRGKQYEVGKTYTEPEADCCHAGMHACENPLDVLHYYKVADGTRFFEVECGGDVSKGDEDSKFSCTELTVSKKTPGTRSKTGNLWSGSHEETLQQALARTAMGCKAAGAAGSHQRKEVET